MTTSRIHILLTLFLVLTLFALASCGGSGGTSTPAPRISVSSTILDFDTVLIENSQDRTVTISNTGNANLTIGNVASDNPLAAPFTVVLDTCSNLTLAPSDSCIVTISYSPTLEITDTGIFDIPSNDPNTSTVMISVTGTGSLISVPKILVSPASLDFGYVLVGTSQDRTVTISNSSNDADLLIYDIAVIDTLAVPFELVAGLDNCSKKTLAPTNNCTITIRYSPTLVQTENDSFDIPSNDPDTATVTVNISGTSVPPPPAIPNPITLDVNTIVISNSLTLGNNTDYWSFAATAGEVYSVEIIGTRLDQEGWQSGKNIPHIKLLDPTGADLLEHHFYDNFINGPWLWGAHDLDMPMLYADQTATYFIAVSKEWPLDPGGQYAIRLTNVTPTTLVAGVEPAIFDGRDNNTQMILPGDTVLGRIDFPDEDNYAFKITNTPAIACFEVTGNRIGVETGENAYLDPSLTLYDADGTTQLADGQTDADIDDYIFSDPKLCYRFDTIGDYFITVDTSTVSAYISSGDYFLNYTLVDTGFTAGVSNNIDASTAQSVLDGEWVNGMLNNGTTTDWYEFIGTTGDMIRITYFDGTNSQTETKIFSQVALRGTGSGTLIFTTDDPFSTGFNETGPGAFTLRGILNAGSVASGTAFYYFTVDGPTSTNYSIKFEKFRPATSAAGTNTALNTLEIQSNNTIGLATSELLDVNGFGAGSIDNDGDIDSFQFNATSGDFITINVYATRDVFNKAHDLSGNGSVFEPVLRVYKSPNTVPISDAVAVARFDPTKLINPPIAGTDVTAEGIHEFLPTISLTFEALPDPNGGVDQIHYMTLSAETFLSGSTYFFEVIRHTNP